MITKTIPKEVERIYPRVPEAAFCPKCHRRVVIPAFLKSANLKGSVRISCAYRPALKAKPCPGVIVIAKPAPVGAMPVAEPTPQEEAVHESI